MSETSSFCADSEKVSNDGALRAILGAKTDSGSLQAPKRYTQKRRTIMNKKIDSTKVRILELLALTNELSADNIKSFFSSTGYAEKMITRLKKDSLIRNIIEDGKPIYRLTKHGKETLREVLPDVFGPLLEGHKTMNRIREEKRRIERRHKLIEILSLFYGMNIKIFPDEKVIMKKYFLNNRTDNTDNTDNTDSIYSCEPEFYTSMEIKSMVPDYKKAIGSRNLGVLFSYGKIYIIYLTENGELLWKNEVEKNFKEITTNTLARKLYGKHNGIYLLVLGEKLKAVQSILNRYDSRTRGMIHPSSDLTDMIFALVDTKIDATLKLITKAHDHVADMGMALSNKVVYDGKLPFFAGHSITNNLEYHLNTYLFDVYNVAAGIKACKDKNMNVIVNCFSYQETYIKSILDKELRSKISFNTIYIEEGSEGDG